MNLRFKAIRDLNRHTHHSRNLNKRESIDQFGSMTFNSQVMEKMLSRSICSHLKECIDGKVKLNPQYVNTIAEAMQEWAVGLGATHFCHWFQPMTGHAAEKQDSFIDWKNIGHAIERFSGKQLLQGEPDASSFPSGGLRNTAEARGYTAWDPSSLPFLWEANGNKVLCLPSIFFSWTGKALDTKIPLLRSDDKINQATLRLFHLLDIKAKNVFSTLGSEQEYFLIDRSFFTLRPDLVMAGRTLCGAPSPKGQELEDHYFGVIKERVAAFMADFEREAFHLGIPLKTRHGEVAPHQFEVAPIFEKASVAVDHNILLMEIMRQVANRHNLSCLLHEKPFAKINGSGKHCNWSLSTDTGMNLLDPAVEGEQALLFLILLTAILHAVHRHSALLRASIGSAGNDHRLGGHEAPPAIISVYLGQELEKWLTNIEQDKAHQSKAGAALDLGIPAVPELKMDQTDRNRTSPFAFTGNKFEFRAVGSSQNCALPVTILNIIVAESLNTIVDEIEKGVLNKKKLETVAMSVVRKYLKLSRPIRFSGDNYSASWHREAKKRKLPVIEKSIHSFESFVSAQSEKVFNGVLSKQELESRFEIMVERYSKIMNIEARLLADMFQTQILPVCLEYQKDVAKSIHAAGEAGHKAGASQKAFLKKLSEEIDLAMESLDALKKDREKALSLSSIKQAEFFCDKIASKIETARDHIDSLETLVDDRLWPLPKYREMLNLL